MKTIKDIPISGKTVFIRVDFNVPLDEYRNITDDTRIRGALPTIRYVTDQGAKLLIASHLGRPKGQIVPELSLNPVADRLGHLIRKPVIQAEDCIGPQVKERVSQLKPGDVMLLENLRFHPGEEKNQDEFGEKLASLCDVYVNDAFAVSHRENASVSAITRFAPLSVAGFLLEKEINYFHKAMENPERPLAAVVGGAKVSSKLAAIENIMHRADKILIGGAMANTFLAGRGIDTGRSKVETDLIATAGTIIETAAKSGITLYLPVDVIAAEKLDDSARFKIVPVEKIPKDWMALDIGPETTLLFRNALQDAETIVWNGPMGAFEVSLFSKGTLSMVNTLAESKALTIVGGGDTDVAVHKANQAEKISYISTGGGAFLKLLEGKPLPALVALEKGYR